MEKDLEIGPETQVVLKIENMKASIGMQYTGKQMSASAGITLSIEAFVQLLKDAIPGKIDDAIFDGLIAVMKGQT